MNRIIIAIIISLSIVATCTISTVFLNNVIDETIVKIEKIEEEIISDNTSEALCSYEDLLDFWLKNEQKLQTSIKHSEVEQVSALIARIGKMIKYSDEKGIILGDLDEIKISLETIQKSSNPTFSNLI
ncbi:MAG: DUF4363 family protein [Oscillospiraceae bacterium]